MADNSFNGVVDSLLKNTDALMGAKTVVGDAMQVGDATIVPLVDVSFGVGAGAKNNDKKNSAAGGMHAKMNPSAVLVIQNGHAKLVSVKNNDTLGKVVDLIPDLIDKFKAKKDGVMNNDEAIDNAFNDEKKED